MSADSTVINIAGRQRMLSQRVAKESLLLAVASEDDINDHRHRLSQAVRLWEESHIGLTQRDSDMGLGGSNSTLVAAELARLQEHMDAALAAARELLARTKVGSDNGADRESLAALAATATAHADRFLPIMHDIVGHYETEASAKIDHLQLIEIILATITILMLLAELLVIFEPSMRQLRQQHERTVERGEEAERLAEMLEQTGRMARIGGWSINLKTMTPVWSNEVYHIHEVEIGQQPPLDEAIKFYAPEARDTVRDAVEAGMKHGAPWDLRLPFITAKGNHRWVRTIGVPEMDGDTCVRLWGAFQDITEQHEAQLESRALAQRLELATQARVSACGSTSQAQTHCSGTTPCTGCMARAHRKMKSVTSCGEAMCIPRILQRQKNCCNVR